MSWLATLLGALLVFVGVVWFFQGINIIPGSFMTGQIEWAVAGIFSIVVGGVVIWRSRRRSGDE